MKLIRTEERFEDVMKDVYEQVLLMSVFMCGFLDSRENSLL